MIFICGSSLTGISRGITAFSNEILLNSQNTFDFTDGYKFSKVFSGYVTYEAFGAVGDGKTYDFDAITKTHAYANAAGLSVFANETAKRIAEKPKIIRCYYFYRATSYKQISSNERFCWYSIVHHFILYKEHRKSKAVKDYR